MAKRKSLNKRSSRYSRGSGGSNVLNPDTNVFDDEQPYWWRHLENNTIVTRSTNSANFNQTSRRLNSNSSIGSNNDLDDGWWKVLEGTPRNLKSLQKGNDLSKKDANDGASRISESEDEVKIAKKKPQLRPEAKKVDGNAFLSALKDPQVLLIPVEKDVSIAQRFSLTTQKLPNKDSATKRRMAEHSNDLLNCHLPNATSTPLERSIASQGSNSDTEPLLKKMKPKTKLLRRHNKDTKKNLFENILMEDQTDIEEAAHRPSANASAAADKSAKEPEPRIVEDESKLEDASKRLHPTEKADHRVSAKYSSDTIYEFREPTKPKSRFLQRTPRENLFQRILSDSDSSITKPSSNHSQNRNSSQTIRRPSVISTESNEDVDLKLSVSSNSSDVDIIRTRNNMVPSVSDIHVEIARSPSEDRIFDAVETSRERSVSGKEKDRSVSLTLRTQLYSDSDEEEDDKASDVTLLTMTSKSLSVKNKSTISSENILTQPEIYPTQQSRKNSAANLTKVSVGNKDSAVAENAYGASDIEFPDLNRSRKRSISRSAQEIAAEEDPTSQPTKKSQKRSTSANFNEERTSSEAELSPRTSLRRQSKRSTTAQQRISSPANVEQTRELENITPRRSKRSEAVRKTSETENVRTYEQERTSRANLNEERTSSEEEGSPRTSLRRQSKRSTTAQQRISSLTNVEQTSELGNITPRRSKRSEAVRKTSETENVRTYERERSSSANFNEERTSSEEEGSKRTSLRRQSKRSTTAQQRISSPATVEQTRELENITPRRSKRSEAVRKTSETENVRTYEQERKSRANLNEERTSSEAERSPRTSLRRQSKRSTTAQQRISSPANVERTRELENITPRRSKRSEAVRKTSETENVRTPQRKSRDAMKESEIRNLKRSLDRSMSRSAQEIAAEGTAMSQATMESQERSSPANINEDRTSSEEEPSAVTSRTAQQLGNTTSRRSKRSEAGRRTSETENVRTPRRKSRGAVKDSEFRDLDRSRERSMSRSAQEIAAEGTAVSQSTMESQERSSPANIDEDSTSSEEEPSAVTSRTAQQLGNTTSRRSKRSEAGRRTSETENVRTPERDSRNVAKVSELEGTLQSRRSRQILVETQESPPSDTPGSDKARSSAARRTSETENVRTPERDSRNVAKVSELEGTLQSRRSRQILVETRETSPVPRPGSDKARSSAAPKGRQKVLEDYFGTNATAIPASQALSNPEMAQEIRKKLDEMKKRELQRMEEKLPVVEKKNRGKGVRAKSNQVNPVPKKVDKAYLVNGVVYKQPRLPRPKKWVTDHLYRYLWKQMEPKYKLETRVKSEKFVRRLSEVSDEIAKRKSYATYKDLLFALMKEMARLGIIGNRFDFYNFCHDFLPYELRAKMVPILLPGNMSTIPYDPKKLYDPLISP
ncbi:uncharacterized protein LOC143210026 [Lasioglossum baleicum]|uniref:uncharacterized protein LOC143210026 n=1 Tax=Lasioglossum baleicum TaxID=434251 RepID=UPI003FCCB5BB